MSLSDAHSSPSLPLEALVGQPQDAMPDVMAHLAAAEVESAQRFAALMPRVVRKALADADPAAIEQAIADGGFVLNDSTVVMRHNTENDQIEFFCDVGLPEPHALEVSYRIALEINLCRTYPGITLGVHPESSRLVATTSIHSLLVGDDEVCLNVLELLTRQVGLLRESRAIPLQTEA